MNWLAVVIRIAVAPVFVGAVVLWLESGRTGRDVLAVLGLFALGTIHLLYWRRPWPRRPHGALIATACAVFTNVVLTHHCGLSQALLWLYPALIVGSGLRAPWVVAGVALLALVAAGSIELEGPHAMRILGANHVVLISIVLAGLGMTAVRQLVEVNSELHLAKAELAETAVARERDRLARELHDLLGRTFAVIAVKAELASRLSAKGDPSAASELRDVQRLARDAVREVREAVADERPARFGDELASAMVALHAADVVLDQRIEPMAEVPHESALASVLREAVTNIVRHSSARRCRIALARREDAVELEVEDDGRGPAQSALGTGLASLADRVRALGGELETGAAPSGGFRVQARIPITRGDSPSAEVEP
ncbi:MAG: sensor histidine kinase [Planctomycetes bacterium]|nr:sensor histidine kinase [Planctomycetota bacterium]